MDQGRISQVVNLFFDSLKSKDDKMLDTGLTQNTTVDLLHHATLQLIKENPGKFEQYVITFIYYLNPSCDLTSSVDCEPVGGGHF